MPFDPIVKRTEGTIKDTVSGKTFKTTKGAPHVLLKLVLTYLFMLFINSEFSLFLCPAVINFIIFVKILIFL